MFVGTTQLQALQQSFPRQQFPTPHIYRVVRSNFPQSLIKNIFQFLTTVICQGQEIWNQATHDVTTNLYFVTKRVVLNPQYLQRGDLLLDILGVRLPLLTTALVLLALLFILTTFLLLLQTDIGRTFI